MTLLIGILDDYHNTDVIILIDYQKKTITWIPRDLYSFRILDRVNAAYIKGGLKLFIQCVQDLGFHNINDCICIPIHISRKIFNELQVYVDISEELEFFYPTKPRQPLQIEKKKIKFMPPGELLIGERIHQFIGARKRTQIKDYKDLPDFDRIIRQQIFMQALIRDKFDFSCFLHEQVDIQAHQLNRFISIYHYPYKFFTYRPAFKIKRLKNKKVLLPLYSYRNLKQKFNYSIVVYLKLWLSMLKESTKKIIKKLKRVNFIINSIKI